jgi:hypothetical protein
LPEDDEASPAVRIEPGVIGNPGPSLPMSSVLNHIRMTNVRRIIRIEHECAQFKQAEDSGSWIRQVPVDLNLYDENLQAIVGTEFM